MCETVCISNQSSACLCLVTSSMVYFFDILMQFVVNKVMRMWSRKKKKKVIYLYCYLFGQL